MGHQLRNYSLRELSLLRNLSASESCAEYVKAYRLRRGPGAPASWDLILSGGDRITVMDPLCASSQLLRFYDMKINCKHHFVCHAAQDA